MKKILVVLMICLTCSAVFAGLNLSAGFGFDSSVGASYEFGKIEVGADVLSTFPAYKLHLAEYPDIPVNAEGKDLILPWLGADAYALFKIIDNPFVSVSTGVGVVINAYRPSNVTEPQRDSVKNKIWWDTDGKELNWFPFQVTSYTATLDAKISVKLSGNSRIFIFAELPVMGYTPTAKSQTTSFTTQEKAEAYLYSCLYLARVGYTYSF